MPALRTECNRVCWASSPPKKTEERANDQHTHTPLRMENMCSFQARKGPGQLAVDCLVGIVTELPIVRKLFLRRKRRATAKRRAVALYHLSLFCFLHSKESTTLYAQVVTLWCSTARVQGEGRSGHKVFEQIGERKGRRDWCWVAQGRGSGTTYPYYALLLCRLLVDSIYHQEQNNTRCTFALSADASVRYFSERRVSSRCMPATTGANFRSRCWGSDSFSSFRITPGLLSWVWTRP